MAYNSSDYSEIFCQSVSQIVKGEINKLGYDVSGEYTIIAIKDRNLGQYQLSDGSAEFTATAAEGTHYEVGDRVIATVPQGDYDKQISILTKIYDEWSGPAGFVRPLDTVIRCTENIVLELKTAGLPANDKNKKYVELFQLSDQKFIGFQKIGISAQFKTLLSGLNVVKGSYGLKFILQKIDRTSDEEKIVKQLDFLFSSDEMLGNPYEFTTYFPQEYAFNIPENFDQVNRIIVGFYQDGQFEDGNGNLIESLAGLNNLFIKDLEIYFGYDAIKEVNEIVELSCDNLTYTGNDSRDVTLRWYHKTSANSMEHINYNRFKENDSPYSVRWYQYWPGATDEEKDEYGGDNWKCFNKTIPGTILSNYPESFTFTMRGQRTTERIKAICFIETHPLVNDETYIVYEQYPSKELVFTNVNETTSGGEAIQEIVNEGFSLQFTDNSFGNYFIYDQNNKIIDVNDLSKPRSIRLLYEGNEINEDNISDLSLTVKWYYPEDDKTMLLFSNNETDTGYELSYSILDVWNAEKGNNTIKCIISVQGVQHTLQETLRFGKQGSNGTTNTFLLEMLDGKNALIAGSDDKTLTVQAILIRSNGKRVYFTEDSLKDNPITWEIINNEGTITKKEELVDKVTLSWNGEEEALKENYTILKASYTYDVGDNPPTLEAYLPIPVRKTGYTNISGATQIIYNHQGTPNYDNGTYIAYKGDEEIKDGWSLNYPKNNEGQPTNPNNPTLKNGSEMGGGMALSAAPLYSKKTGNNSVIQDKVCVYCEADGIVVWSQPILIMQSPYDFAMLNSWDGNLTIDENNGTILSTMLGAGRKNDQNKFSGVLIGDIQGGTELEETETMTGVYGFQNGVMTYGLKENGTAFFGAYNRGRIEIDGTSGVIRSPSENGMTIDLDDGLITAKNFNLTAGNDTNGKISITNSSFEISKGAEKISFSTGNDGLNISAKNFNLTAGDDTNGKISITNNSFEVGKNNDKISFSVADGLNILAKNFNLSAGEWSKGRIEINSNPGNNGYYFAAGLDNYSGEGAFGNTNERYFTIGPNNFEIKTPNFWIKTDGSVQIKGNITATSLSLNNTLLVGAEPSETTTGFKVTSDGIMSASGATIYGTIYATSGKIGGCTIAKNKLTIENANIANLSVDKLTTGTNNNKLTFTNIHAQSGTIGNWVLTATSLTNGTPYTDGFIGLYNDSGNKLVIGSKFAVNSKGELTCSGATITGKSFSTDCVKVYGSYMQLTTDGVYVTFNNFGFSTTTYGVLSWDEVQAAVRGYLGKP